MVYDHRKFLLPITLSAFILGLAPFSVSATSLDTVLDNASSTAISGSVTPPASGPVVGVVTAQYKLNVRSAPWGEIIDGFLPGVKVEILGQEGEWYQIRNGAGTAYVHTSLVSIESGTPKIIASNATFPTTGTTTARYSLNVRRGPWGEIIDGYKYGTQVEIIGREGDWYIIRYGGDKAYVHTTLVSLNGKNPTSSTVTASTPSTTQTSQTPQPANNTYGPANNQASSGGINGPGIPPELIHGIEAAKKTQWYTTPDKCLQFAGTVTHEAGAPDSGKTYTQPQAIWPADTTLRGYYINELPKAVEAGQLLPGMLIHVKVHYDYDPAYNPTNDAHHWFVYVGKDAQGVPRFTDNLKSTDLQTADQVYNYMNGGSAKKYGDAKYGYNRRVHAVFDPFASVR